MKKYLLAGLLVWLPLAITLWVLHSVLGLLDGVFGAVLSATGAVLPEAARPAIDMLRQIPGLSVIVMVGGLLLTGIFAPIFSASGGCARAAACSTKFPSSSRSTAR